MVQINTKCVNLNDTIMIIVTKDNVKEGFILYQYLLVYDACSFTKIFK